MIYLKNKHPNVNIQEYEQVQNRGLIHCSFLATMYMSA